MNSTLTLNTTTADTNPAAAKANFAASPSITFAQVRRTLAHKWDMIAVIGLMVSSAVYAVYALTQMTGF